MAKIILVLAIAVILTDAQRTSWIRRKPTCPPSFKVTLQPRVDGRENLFRGTCSVTARRQDTCRRRMSCCENSNGEMLCIRARTYRPRYRAEPLPAPVFPPMPPMNDMMQNDMEIRNSMCPDPAPLDKPCTGDPAANICASDFNCATDRICCPDPCPSDMLPVQLCLKPRKALSHFPIDGFQQESFPLQGSNGNNFPIEMTPSAADKIPAATETVKTDQSRTVNKHGTDFLTATAPHPNCPKTERICNGEDETQCTVACAAYDQSYNECQDDSNCATGRICCADPCPNSPLKLCFPDVSQEQQKLVAAEANLPPPPPPTADILLQDVGMQRTCPAPSKEEFCIGWVADPKTNRTGLCESFNDCIEDEVCCKLSACVDNTKYCVKPVDPLMITGCPIPGYFKPPVFTECSGLGKPCGENKICCNLDIHGTIGCVNVV